MAENPEQTTRARNGKAGAQDVIATKEGDTAPIDSVQRLKNVLPPARVKLPNNP